MTGFPIHARYANPDAGTSADRAKAERLLEVGRVYTIRLMEVGRSSSALLLEEVPGEWLNTVMFDPDPGPERGPDDPGPWPGTEYVIQFRDEEAPPDGLWTDHSIKPLGWPEDVTRDYVAGLRRAKVMGCDYRVLRRQVVTEITDW
jgi:hypothetical protein